MTSEQFVYWLQGFFEIQGVGTEDDMEGVHPEQAKVIHDHLNLVFDKKTPERKIDKEKLKKTLKDNISNKSRRSLKNKRDMDFLLKPLCSSTKYCSNETKSVSIKDLEELMGDIKVEVSC